MICQVLKSYQTVGMAWWHVNVYININTERGRKIRELDVYIKIDVVVDIDADIATEIHIALEHIYVCMYTHI